MRKPRKLGRGWEPQLCNWTATRKWHSQIYGLSSWYANSPQGVKNKIREDNSCHTFSPQFLCLNVLAFFCTGLFGLAWFCTLGTQGIFYTRVAGLLGEQGVRSSKIGCHQVRDKNWEELLWNHSGWYFRVFSSHPTIPKAHGTSLVVQWLRPHAPCAEGPGQIPTQGTRSHMLQLRPMCAQSLSLVLFATLWTVTGHAPLSMEFFRQDYWNGLLFPSPRDLRDPGIETESPASPALAGGFFTTELRPK